MSTTTHGYAPGDAGAGRDPERRTIAGDLRATYVDLITVQQLPGHASVHTTT